MVKEKLFRQLRRLGRNLLDSNFSGVQLGPSSEYAKEYSTSHPFIKIPVDDLDPSIRFVNTVQPTRVIDLHEQPLSFGVQLFLRAENEKGRHEAANRR